MTTVSGGRTLRVEDGGPLWFNDIVLGFLDEVV